MMAMRDVAVEFGFRLFFGEPGAEPRALHGDGAIRRPRPPPASDSAWDVSQLPRMSISRRKRLEMPPYACGG